MFSLDVWNLILAHMHVESLHMTKQTCKTVGPLIEPFILKVKIQVQTLRCMFFDISDKLRAEYNEAWRQNNLRLTEVGREQCIKGTIHQRSFCIMLSRSNLFLQRFGGDSLIIFHDKFRRMNVEYALPADVYVLVNDAIFGSFSWAV